MSQEFKDDGIAVNALWPKTGIATVAVMVTAGKEGLAYCRTDRVFADAAYVVLTRDSRARTGEFLYDEDVLREAGVTDFEQYSYIPAGGPLPDGFVECYSPEVRGTSSETTESASPRGPLKGVQEVIEAMKSFCNKELVQGVKGVFEFHLTGKEPGVWHLDLKNNAGSVSSGSFQGGEVDSTMTVDSEDFVRLFTGQLNPAQAYLRGQIQIKGSQARFMKLEKQLMEKMKSKL